ncbi:uncharacterized protein CTRU02_212839 [Colletotrichum truncatum]|uniref:Uncharacterized protein n=1 Tax=Colletotrichum truncatum TaxID=5467 RepID=A0ACC3YJ12_COLTU|nr:uncharacterized protein CTRU02_03162 [Colletotrichum truncatum]KAF6797131.1 hypothetical protein CTRU02_03162 [Colletotrichum truncatum]
MASFPWSSMDFSFWGERSVPLGLGITSTLSLILVIFLGWTVDSTWYESSLAGSSSTSSGISSSTRFFELTLGFVTAGASKRAIVEFVIRLIALILGFLHVSVIVVLTQNDTISDLLDNAVAVSCRSKESFSSSVSKPRQLMRSRSVPSILTLSCLGIFSTALWAGAMTPTSGTIATQNIINVPSFSNTTYIKEYPIESKSGPSVTTKDGTFSYSVGTKYLSQLIASASSATTIDGTLQRQPKPDNTRFSYEGRSYGVGSSVGIQNGFKHESSARVYHFQEVGYFSQVDCRYNESMDFHIAKENPYRTFAATGSLPDSVGSIQWSEYIGITSSSILAIGVAKSPESRRRYISIAAGDNYKALNTTQCTVDFLPTLFQLSVDVKDRSIAVVPLKGIEAKDLDPQRTLTRTAVRQFDLISNSLTNYYDSVLGNAFLSSIAAWNTSFNEQGLASEADATLHGLQNSITAMMDSILVAYGAAQLVVGNFSQPTTAEVVVDVFVLGNQAYIGAVALLNAIIILAFSFRAAPKTCRQMS